MATTNTKTTLQYAMKYVVENEIKDLVPNSSKIQDMAEFKQVGRKFLQPVALTNELGVTYGSGAFSYDDAIAAVYDEAEIDPNPVVLRSQFDYSSADRMVKEGKAAVISHARLRATRLKASLSKFLEIDAMYGQSDNTGIGKISAVSDSSGTNVLTISAATWATGIWAGMEGARLDAYDGGTKQNTNADLVISSVDVANKTVTVTGNTTDTAALAADDVLFFKGSYSNGQTGLYTQLDNAGTLFGIDASSYSLWKSTEFAVGGALTFAKVLQAAGQAVGKGLDGDCVLVCNPEVFENLNDDLAALRSFDSSYSSSKAEMGSGSIVYHGQVGKIEIVSHPYCHIGSAMLLPKDELMQIGATDITFGIPGGSEGEYINALEGSHGFQVICRAEKQIFLGCPAKAVLLTGITV